MKLGSTIYKRCRSPWLATMHWRYACLPHCLAFLLSLSAIVLSSVFTITRLRLPLRLLSLSHFFRPSIVASPCER